MINHRIDLIVFGCTLAFVAGLMQIAPLLGAH